MRETVHGSMMEIRLEADFAGVPAQIDTVKKMRVACRPRYHRRSRKQSEFDKALRSVHMSDQDFVLTFDYDVPAETLYEQFATAEGVQNWWTEKCEMEARIGGRAKFPFPEAGFHALATIGRLDKNQCVEWTITESKHPESSGWMDLHDWEGTTIRFQIEARGSGGSRLRFTHEGLVPLECADSCSSLWRYYLNESLRRYFETGKGAPYRDNHSADFQALGES